MKKIYGIVIGIFTLLILGLIINRSTPRGSDLLMRLTANKTSFLEYEPVFILASIHNQGTKTSEVVYGKYMLDNIHLWTSVDRTVKKSKRLLEGGIHAGETGTSLRPQETHGMLLLVDDWLTLPAGKPVLHVRIRWETGELSASLPVVISKSSDEELEETLKQIVVEMWTRGSFSATSNQSYRDGLKDACYNPRTRAALERIKKTLTDARPLEIVNEILLNYNRGISD